MLSCQLLAVLVLTAPSAAPGPASSSQPSAEWPQWRGPNRDSISSEKGLLKQWPEGGPKLLWTAKGAGVGFSSMAVADGMIYTAGVVDGQTFVLAFNMEGQLKWKSANGKPWQPRRRQRWASSYGGSRATPTVEGGRVYHLGELGRLAALDARSGREIWHVDLLKTFAADVPKYGYAESVLIDGERLIVYAGGAKGSLVALDKKTGRTIWANVEFRDTPAYSSAILAAFGGVRQIITLTEQSVVGFRADDGRLLWRHPFTNSRRNNVATPVYHDGHIYASSGYGTGSLMLRLKAEGDRVTAEKAWQRKELDNHHGGVVLVDGHLYGTGHNRRGWWCLDFHTGEPAHRAKGKGAVTYADGMLYFLDEGGTMHLVEAKPAAHRRVSSFRVPSGGKGLYWSHPVVVGGRLYIRHADRLYAYHIKAE